MIKKIISGGQTGADRAALHLAIKHKILYGGWVPKGRRAEDGTIPAMYKFDEMPTSSYLMATEQNVIDSDGTLIISHGRLAGRSKWTRKIASRYRKPWLHIDLEKTKAFDAVLPIFNWVRASRIETLHVTGSKASKDHNIYRQVKAILHEVQLLIVGKNTLIVPAESSVQQTARRTKRPTTVDEAIDQLIAKLKLRDLINLTKMAEEDLIDFHFTLGMWIRKSFIYPRNDKLLESCSEVSGDKYLYWAQIHMVILRQLWKRLQKTHKLKLVK